MKVPSKSRQHLISTRALLRNSTVANKPLQNVAGNRLSASY